MVYGPSVLDLGQRSAQSLKNVCVGKAPNTSKQHKTDEDSTMAGEIGRGSTGKGNIPTQRTTGRDRETIRKGGERREENSAAS